MKTMSLASVEWALHVALSIERRLRNEADEAERERLRNLRDWHFSSLSDEQIQRRDTA